MDPGTFLESVWGMIWGVSCTFSDSVWIHRDICIRIYISSLMGLSEVLQGNSLHHPVIMDDHALV